MDKEASPDVQTGLRILKFLVEKDTTLDTEIIL